jgi:hypothetical protein
MTYTQQKLIYANIMLEQAKQNYNDYTVFMANLDAFVTDARSVTFIMKTEFDSIKGFREWYSVKQDEMKDYSDFDFFNKLRVNTTHVRPFNTVTKISTAFPEGMTLSGGKTVEIPLGEMGDRDFIIDNQTPVIVNGNAVNHIKRSTTRNYFFTDKPNEDAIARCEAYFQKLKELVTECHSRFNIL